MSELKTTVNKSSVSTFIKKVEDQTKREDCLELVSLMKSVTGHDPEMWGTSIVGFGSYHYRYESGREGDWMVTGFAARKQQLVIYIMPGFSEYAALMKKLGKYKTGVSCLYVKRLDDIDRGELRILVRKSVDDMKKIYTCT